MAAQASPSPAALRRHRQRAIAAAIVGASAMYLFTDVHPRPEFASVAVPSGQDLRVEIARTSEQRARGLSDRSHVGADGLFLVWPDAGEHPIWMAGMRFPLDLAWLDVAHRVVAIEAHAQPCTGPPCPLFRPPTAVRSVAVLELPAGDAARYQIAVGATIAPRPESPDASRSLR